MIYTQKTFPKSLREICEGHLKTAQVLHGQHNYVQALHHSELAVTKLKQLQEDRHVDGYMVDEVMKTNYNVLHSMGQHPKAVLFAKEWHILWLDLWSDDRNNTLLMHAPDLLLNSPVALIESSIHNNDFVDAESFARGLWTTITSELHHFPEDQRQAITSRGAYWLAQAAYYLSANDGVAPDEKEIVGDEVISLARTALEIDTQLFGIESEKVACDLALLARVLKYFNNVVDDEVLRMYEKRRHVAVTARRRKGSSSTGDDGMK